MTDLPPDLLPDPDADPDAELVNDYLDDVLEADDRARIEASPALVEQVTGQRAVRQALSTPPLASAAARSSAVAAALTEFDATARAGAGAASRSRGDITNRSAGLATGTPPDELALRRHRGRRYVNGAVAAAAAVAVIFGAVALTRPTSDLTSAQVAASTAALSSTSAAAPAIAAAAPDAAPSSPAATSATRTVGDAGTAGDATASGSAAKTATSAAVIDAAEQLLTLARPTVDSAGASRSEPEGSTPGAAATTAAAPAASTAPDGTRCVGPDDTFLATIVYRSTPAVAVIDDRRHVRRALDADTCAVLAEIADTP